MKGILSLRGFRKLRTGAIVATGVFLFATSNGQLVQASEEDGVWEARTVEQVKADIASLAKDSNYVIKWGDTLSVISEATGISMDALAQMNQITNINLIYAHNELGFTQPISTTTGNQTISKQTVTVVNRQNSQEEVKAFEVTTKEDTQSGKTETVVTEVKPTTKEEIPVTKTEQATVVTGKEEAAKVNQTVASSQPTEKQSKIDKAETPKVDKTPATTAKVEEKKADQAPAVVNPAKTPVTTETKEPTPSKSTEEKKQTEGTTPKETTEGKVDSKKATLPTEKTSKDTTSEKTPTSPTPVAESEGKVESPAPTTNGEENTTAEKKTEPKTDQAPTAVNPTETPVATETKETTPSKPTEEKKQTEGTTPKETTEGKVESPAPTTNGEENTTAEKKTGPKADQAPTAVNPTETPVATETKETTPSKPTEEKEDKQIEQPTTNTPSKDSVENNTIAPSPNNSSNEGSKHEEEKKDETVVPEEDTKANKEALESHKQNKLDEINKSSLSPEQKEQAITKVKELTANAEKAIEGAATSEEQAKVVDQYENDLAAIETPNVETPKPDFTKPVESHNPTGSTTIGEGGAISTLASSTPTASAPVTSESAATTPVVSEAVAPNAPAASTPVTSEPASSESVVSTPTASAPAATTPVVSNSVAPSAPATSAPATGEPAASTSEASASAISTPSTGAPTPSTSTVTNSSASDASTANTSSEHTGFRNAPVYQPRVVRRARSVDAPKDQIAIYYNFAEMKDIAGFLGDPGNSIITVPAGATSDEIRTIVKDKIDVKKAELAKRGYTFMDDYFVDKPQEDTIRYDYVVNFTKAASLRVAPVSQPRAARNRRSVVESPVKTRTITFYYQLAGLEIAGALGTPGKNYVITVPETASAAEIQQVIDDATRSEKAELGRYFKYVRETNLQTDILDRGFGNFDYVITFTR